MVKIIGNNAVVTIGFVSEEDIVLILQALLWAVGKIDEDDSRCCGMIYQLTKIMEALIPSPSQLKLK